MKIRPIPVPSDTLIARYLPADYADAFRCDCPLPETITPDDVHLAFWTTAPGWVETLTRLRDRLVRPLGLTSSGNDRSARKLWVQQSITDRSTTETVIAKDDKRLRFLCSVRIDRTAGNEPRITFCTVVHLHNRSGKIYFALIRPLHKRIVPTTLKNALRRLQEPKQP